MLIDSRTGHTDTAGICTRQLTDAVLILFFPNEQNLRGLTKVVQDIRSEARKPRKKKIDLHFVMSNVPDLDDEDRILESKINAFQKQLDFRREPMVVHRYNSLALLNQVVFTKDRPGSRLAQEYHDVVREIVRGNLEDREGALDYINRAGRPAPSTAQSTNRSRRWTRRFLDIEERHSSDGDVLFSSADCGRINDTWSAIRYSIARSSLDIQNLMCIRARARADSGDPDGAHEACTASAVSLPALCSSSSMIWRDPTVHKDIAK